MFSSMLSLLGSLRGGSSFVTNSLRFRSSASANLSRTPSVAGNRQVWTWSAWIKRGTLGEYALFGATSDASNRTFIRFNSSDQLDIRRVDAGTSTGNVTTAVFRDCSAWYHVVISVDFSQASATSRAIIYVNGVQQTLGTSSVASGSAIVNLNTAHRVGYNESSFYFDGYLTDVNFIDGQALTPASFGAIDSSTGVWAPRPYSGTYGTNGFYLKFANTSSVAALGNDSSGNNNTWTVNNVSLTAGATYDSMIDVPVNYSDGGNGRGNYAVLNPTDRTIDIAAPSILNGNLTIAATSSITSQIVRGTVQLPSAGKWYWEQTLVSGGLCAVGITLTSARMINGAFETYLNSIEYQSDGNKNVNGTVTSYGASYVNGDTVGIAIDIDANTLTFLKNNISQGSISITSANGYSPNVRVWSSSVINTNFGQRPFTYTPPAGFRALNTNNLPTPSIVNGANFMAATTYTGTGGVQSIPNTVNSVSFQPDLVWIKSRTPGATNHALFDSARGTTKYLSSNTTTGETTLAQSLTAFGADGFSLGTDTTLVNANANSYVAWQWKAGGAAVSNTQGTITSQVSANTTAGFSVVTYTGTGVNATVGHGLGVAPKMVIVKQRSATAASWVIWQSTLSATEFLQFDTTAKQTATNVWNSAIPTSLIFSIGSNVALNTNGNNYVAYCFAEIAGFSKFGSYTGNGSADGPFVFCGFRPRWVMIKRTDVADDWGIFDTTRDASNAATLRLRANDAGTELSTQQIDITSNGLKIRVSNAAFNATGGTYIFAAFAEVPSKYALAR